MACPGDRYRQQAPVAAVGHPRRLPRRMSSFNLAPEHAVPYAGERFTNVCACPLDMGGQRLHSPGGTGTLRPRDRARSTMYANLFDRFCTDGDPGPEALAAELADLLGGRRMFGDSRLGVLSWGLPPMLNLVAKSIGDRQYVAACIADAIQRFQPRLENVRVSPVEGARDFSFVIEATLVEASSSIQFRILSPHVGGGLGAKVDVVTIRDDFSRTRA